MLYLFAKESSMGLTTFHVPIPDQTIMQIDAIFDANQSILIIPVCRIIFVSVFFVTWTVWFSRLVSALYFIMHET